MTARHKVETKRVKRFTPAMVEKIKVRKTVTIWSDSGLALRVSAAGAKSWRCVYRMHGRQRWLTLGRFPKMSVGDAIEAHGKAIKLRERGIDPADVAVEKRRDEQGALTVSGLVEEYLERYARPNKKSWRDDERYLRAELSARYGKRKAADLKRRDIIGIIDRIVARGAGVAANRVLAVLKTCFAWAVEVDLLESSPCALVKKPVREAPRVRYLSLEEVGKLLVGLDRPDLEASKTVRLALRLLLATGQRPGEVAGIHAGELDLTDGWWNLPPERTKNGKGNRVPLSSYSQTVIAEARLLNRGSQYLFPGKGTEAAMRPLSMARALSRNLEAIGLAECTPRDLRRTVATHLSAMGHPRLVVMRILNHSDRAITAVYDRYAYARESQVALEQWGQKLLEVKAAELARTEPAKTKKGARR